MRGWSVFPWLIGSWLAAGAADAGGPLLVQANGLPIGWSTAAEIQYRTDNGPLSATVNEAAARTRVTSMFNVWEDVATASIGFNRAGFINAVGAFGGGDVDTPAEYAAVENDCFNGNQSPVIYDADGSIMIDLGVDETSVIGFAGPCAGTATTIVSGRVLMNGLFQDGQAAPVNDIPAAAFDAAIIHEVGHFAGLDHSQINVNCASGCVGDDLEGLPTMFPLLVSTTQATLSIDDIAWISRLYPQTTGATTLIGTHGFIRGIVFFSDGQSHAQLVNVIARRVDTGGNEDRRMAVSVVSGYRFAVFHGNPITGDPAIGGGSSDPGEIGFYDLAVPAGSYTIEVESVDSQFVDGSSVGPYAISMPGVAPPPTAPISVAAGVTESGHNITLIGTQPRFDQFEGPGP